MADSAHDEDALLVERANRGDADAFRDLYRRHRDWVARVAFRFTGDEEDALDVLQETFAYLFDKFPGFVLSSRLRTFLYPAVKHRALDVQRRKRRTEPQAEPQPTEQGAPPSTARLEAIRLLAHLPEEQRELVQLRFADDMSLGDIATSLDLPLGTVKSRLHSALQKLRQILVSGDKMLKL